jgi:hypothetical protein
VQLYPIGHPGGTGVSVVHVGSLPDWSTVRHKSTTSALPWGSRLGGRDEHRADAEADIEQMLITR